MTIADTSTRPGKCLWDIHIYIYICYIRVPVPTAAAFRALWRTNAPTVLGTMGAQLDIFFFLLLFYFYYNFF